MRLQQRGGRPADPGRRRGRDPGGARPPPCTRSTGCCVRCGFTIPQWFKDKHTVAYYDMYEHPEDDPALCAGRTGFLVVQRRKTRGPEGGRRAALSRGQAAGRGPGDRHGRLYPPAAAADHPDADRDHGDQLRPDPVRPRRADRTDHRPAWRARATCSARSPAAATKAADNVGGGDERYLGARGLPPDFIAALEIEMGFARIVCEPGYEGEPDLDAEACVKEDIPALERFLNMMWRYMRFDFGESYFRSIGVFELIAEKLPVSITLGLWSTRDRLSRLDPARHPQGGARRLAVRHLHLRHDHRRLRDPGLPVRDPAAGAVRRRLLLADLPAARADLGQLGRAQPDRQGARLFLAHHPAGAGLDHRQLRHADAC